MLSGPPADAARRRADQLLVERGLASSRAQAQAAIEAGRARADGKVIAKPSEMIAANAALDFEPAHPWVSRGGVKLAHALEAFAVDPAGRFCLDVGASTGGFTDVLLHRGAARVAAVDVGRDQLHAKLRADPRVLVLEGQDARTLTPAVIGGAPSLIVCDASFIGLAKVIATPLTLAAPSCDLVALIKPQFEAGPGRGHALAYEDARRLAEETAGALEGLSGFRVQALIDSPIPGGEGAREFLLHAQRTP